MLGRIALRMAAIEALKGNTLVDDNVLDSQIGALDVNADGDLRTDQEKPFISVYVESAKLEDKTDLRALHRSGPTELVIEIGITAAMTEVDPETGAAKVIGLGIPATDPAFEFFLDCVGRQVVNALTDPNNEWAEVWRSLSSGTFKIERRRTSDASHGIRIAAHQMVITVGLLPDPVKGEPVAETSAWMKFFDKCAESSDPVLIKKREAMMDLLGDPDNTLNSEAQRQRFGMTLDEVRALSDMAVEPGEPTEPNLASFTTDITPDAL